MTDILLITGMSGAGRTEAAAVLEDLGWYVVDNLPVSLVDTIVELASAPGSRIDRLALVSGRQHLDVLDKIGELRELGHRVRVVFLNASDAELVNRYESTRRRHPLVGDGVGLTEAIELERRLLDPLRQRADLVFDTTRTNVHELRQRVVASFEESDTDQRLQILLRSFGFKHGAPIDADIVMDVRFLPNPYWQPELRSLRGTDDEVSAYVLSHPGAVQFVDRFSALLLDLLPAYVDEGKSHLTVAIGCTGGHHRSVAVVEELRRRLLDAGYWPQVNHRDLLR